MGRGAPPGRGRVKVAEIDDAAGPDSPPSRAFVPVICQHCDEAACLEACPTGALYRGDGGLVLFDAALCASCGACESACPFGAISLSQDAGMPEKCDLCAERQAKGLLPSCAQHCPGRAIRLGSGSETGKRSFSRGRVTYLSRAGDSRG